MTEKDATTGSAPAPKPHWRHPGLWLLALAAVLLILVNIGLGLTGKVISAPAWVVERIEARANLALAGVASAKVGGAELVVDGRFVPHVRLRAVELFAPSGARIAILPDLRTTLKAQPILRGRLEPRTLSMFGAQIALRRLPDGSLDLSVGADMTGVAGALGPAEVVKAVDAAFALPVLNGIERITVEGLDLRLRDDRSGQVWNAAGGWLAFNQTAAEIGIDLGFTVEEAGRRQARAQISFTSVKGSPESTLSARITDVSARDLATQSPALAWLAALDAPISGSIRSGIAADGSYSDLNATLEIGAGALQPTEGTKPVRFDRARIDLDYDPATGEIVFPDIALDGPALQVRAGAKAWLKDVKNGLPSALVGQVKITDLKADPEGLFADPVTFSEGALDFRLALDPFRVDLGQLVLLDGDRRISAKGDITTAPEGWAVALDVAINRIESERLLALWPVAAVPKTRAWLEENVATSELFAVKSAFRLRPGTDPHFMLGWEFRDTEVRILKTLPPVEEGAGYATINGYTYTLVVDRGHVTAPEGGRVEMAGSVMEIPDLRIKPAPARFTLRTDSAITAALSLLDQPPFQFLTKSERPVDLAEGRARVEAVLEFALAPKIATEDVDYNVKAELSDVRSEKIAPGRMLAAGALTLTANRAGMEISGPATLSGIPIDVRWRQEFTPEQKGKSRVDGTMELSRRALEAFGVELPKGTVSGTGRATVTLDLAKGEATDFAIASDLAGVTLRIPEIGWSKTAVQRGRFAIRGRLGQPAEIDRMELAAAGLTVAGDLVLKADGGFDAARFGTARLGNWFDGQVNLTGRGKGQSVGVTVNSGRLDLRRATFGAGGGSGGGPITVALDRLQVSDGVALTGFRGNFTTRTGFTGDFTGRVNGEAPVRGSVLPDGARSAFRITADDAGSVLRAAGVFTRGVGGAFDMALRPLAADGQYDGTLAIRGIRVVDAPALADLLDAISVVGLLSQLNGPGILFSDVKGRFHLTPSAVEIREGSAVGPSLGISAAGTYQAGAGQLDLQGTISPVYMLNGIGQIFSKRREGLFGFNYRLTGRADDPKVTVNPLSIFTPGMFREIFRAEPPKLSQ
ncbi:AsmA-like C-terminal region-containing protein [Defluviimonas sp. SAOS-178_SWC]|uniref:AsmA-like C-terminal region-containing protein n=1 Tax=Defluviimonas sp. SAOS-178_SWC TaxID=3121287 RepID=UPI003221B353